MKRIILGLFVSLWGAYAGAQVPMTGAGKGNPGSAPAGYTGPGDLSFSTPLPYYSLRAYSSATRGNNLINVCDPVNITCADWKSDATTGNLVATTNPLNGTDCTTATTCTIKTAYDISGTTLCAGTLACDATQTVAALRPTLTWNCVNSHPCMVFVRTSSQTLVSALTAAASASQPMTVVGVANRNGLGGFDPIGIFVGGSFGSQFSFNNGSADLLIFAGVGNVTASGASASAWHAAQGLYSGASSLANVDGVDGSTGNAGTTAWATAQPIAIGSDTFGNFMDGKITEFGAFNSAINRTTMCHNLFAYWGTAVSC